MIEICLFATLMLLISLFVWWLIRVRVDQVFDNFKYLAKRDANAITERMAICPKCLKDGKKTILKGSLDTIKCETHGFLSIKEVLGCGNVFTG